MAKSKTKQAKAVIPYARRAIESDYAQEQLRRAVTQLRDVYKRASRERGKASEDKQLYAKVREAATSIRKAVGAIEEPPPPKRRGRKLVALLGLAAIAGLALKKRSGASEQEHATASAADTHADGEARASQAATPEPVG